MGKQSEDLVSEGLVTIREAAEFLGIGRTLVYVLLEQGHLPSAKIGRRRVIPKQALIRFSAERLSGQA